MKQTSMLVKKSGLQFGIPDLLIITLILQQFSVEYFSSPIVDLR